MWDDHPKQLHLALLTASASNDRLIPPCPIFLYLNHSDSVHLGSLHSPTGAPHVHGRRPEIVSGDLFPVEYPEKFDPSA
jgi:hypothetical protein